MTGWLVDVKLRGAESEAVARVLASVTGQAAIERDPDVVGFSLDRAVADAAVAELSRQFGAAVEPLVSRASPDDWTARWREGFAVRAIGKLRVGPSWLLSPGPDAVVIDPEMAFGSGEHGSTRGAIRALSDHLPPNATLIDLGSGSGILSIAAVKLGARYALGIEIDPEAIPIAEANASSNEVAGRVRFLEGDAALLAPLAGPVDVVVSNILRSVNESLLDPIRRSLRPDGLAIFSGMEEPEQALFEPALQAAGFRVVDQVRDEGWWTVVTRVPPA